MPHYLHIIHKTRFKQCYTYVEINRERKNVMKKYAVILLCGLLIFSALLTSCASDKPTTVPDTVLPYSYDGTTFTYGGKDFDITASAPLVNSISNAQTVGSVVVVECHVNPKNNVYLIFDAVTEDFSYELDGTNLVWHSNDITTAVYSFWGDILNYEGNVVGSIGDFDTVTDFVSGIEFAEDNKSVLVTCVKGDDTVTEVFEIK